jgi:hypothetical protein
MQFAHIPRKRPNIFLLRYRRKVALDIADYKNQETQKNRDLNNNRKRKLKVPTQRLPASAPGRKSAFDQSVQPFHSKYLVLKKSHYYFENLHKVFNTASRKVLSYQNYLMYSPEKAIAMAFYLRKQQQSSTTEFGVVSSLSRS